jgi:predicted phosphodiesterase
LPALDAVYADIEARGVGERYCLGDLVGYGPRPGEVIARIITSGDPVVRGNYDEGIGTRRGDCGCYYPTEEARADGAVSYAFTDAALDDIAAAYLASLPDEIRLQEAGARVLLVHGSPRRINEYLMADRPDDNLAKLADLGSADVVCHGHTHLPYHRVLTAADGRAVHFIGAGSVGRPKGGDPRACWAEVVFGTKAEVNAACDDDSAAGPVGSPTGEPRESGQDAEVSREDERVWVGARFHRAAYDFEAVAREVVSVGLPLRLADALRTG